MSFFSTNFKSALGYLYNTSLYVFSSGSHKKSSIVLFYKG